AGAEAVQVFDSWVGHLAPADYARAVLPHMQKLFGRLDRRVPAIHFSTGTGGEGEGLPPAGGGGPGPPPPAPRRAAPGGPARGRRAGHPGAPRPRRPPRPAPRDRRARERHPRGSGGAARARVQPRARRASDDAGRQRARARRRSPRAERAMTAPPNPPADLGAAPRAARRADRPLRLVVVGGGITGLAAARHAIARAGATDVALTVLDAGTRPGGVLATERVGDFLVEGGPDSFVVDKPEAVRLAGDLGLAGDVVPTNARFRRTLVVRDGELVPLPDAFQLMAPG